MSDTTAKTATSPIHQNVTGEAGDLTTNIDFFKPSKSAIEAYEDLGVGAEEVSIDSDEGGDPGDEDEKPKKKRRSGGDDPADHEADADAGEEEDGEEDSDDEEEEGEAEEEEAESALETKGKKGITVKLGDKEVSVDPNAVIPTVVNGKTKNPTLQQLKDSYSSKQNFADENNKLKTERASVERERDEVQKKTRWVESEHQKFAGILSTFKEAVAKKDVGLLINEMLELTQQDAVAFWENYHEQNSQYYAQYNQLSPDEKKVLAERRKNQILNSQLERKNAETSSVKQTAELQGVVRTILSETGLTDEAVQGAWRELDQLAREGAFNRETIEGIKALNGAQRYRFAADWQVNKIVDGMVRNSVSRILPDVDDSETIAILKEVRETLGPSKIREATKEDLDELIREAYGKPAAPKKQKMKGSSTSLSGKAQPRQKAETSSEDDLFDHYGANNGKPTSQVWGAQFQKFS